MLMMIIVIKRKEVKYKSVRIKKVVLDLHGLWCNC